VRHVALDRALVDPAKQVEIARQHDHRLDRQGQEGMAARVPVGGRSSLGMRPPGRWSGTP
jgi:hypothetical protein